jgi:hypothetical protein
MTLSEKAYYQWVWRLELLLGIRVFGMKEYKNEVEYRGVYYNKMDLLRP